MGLGVSASRLLLEPGPTEVLLFHIHPGPVIYRLSQPLHCIDLSFPVCKTELGYPVSEL